MASGSNNGKEGGVAPLFILISSLMPVLAEGGNAVDGLKICRAMSKVVGFDMVDGAQRIRGVWRLYLKSHSARSKLLREGFSLGGLNFSVFHRNPLIVKDPNIASTKLIIGKIPISVDSDIIKETLMKMGVHFLSPLSYECYRSETGGWTPFKTGRRFAYIALPESNLPESTRVGNWFASLYYREQIRANRGNSTGNQAGEKVGNKVDETNVAQAKIVGNAGDNENTRLKAQTCSSYADTVSKTHHGESGRVSSGENEEQGVSREEEEENDIEWSDLSQRGRSRQPLISCHFINRTTANASQSVSPGKRRGRKRAVSPSRGLDKRQRSVSMSLNRAMARQKQVGNNNKSPNDRPTPLRTSLVTLPSANHRVDEGDS